LRRRRHSSTGRGLVDCELRGTKNERSKNRCANK
jgi:hypothetical protein